MPKVLYSGMPQEKLSLGDALVEGADAVAPVVGGGEVAAEAKQGRVEILKAVDHVGIHAGDVVGGLEADLVDDGRGCRR